MDPRVVANIVDSGDTWVVALIVVGMIITTAITSFFTYLQNRKQRDKIVNQDKKINQIDISNTKSMNTIIENSDSFKAMNAKTDRDYDRINAMESNVKDLKAGLDHLTKLTLLQCVYQRPTSKEKHLYIINRCHEYLNLLKSRGETDYLAEANLHSLEHDLADRNERGDWTYKVYVAKDDDPVVVERIEP